MGWGWSMAKDGFVVGVLSAMSLWLRYWRIELPRHVVLDEIHFGKFVHWYARGEYYLDIHPPLARLTLYGVGTMLGLDPSFSFNNTADEYESDAQFVPMRLVSATFGALLVPLTFCLARSMGASRIGSIIAAASVLFENMSVTQSRCVGYGEEREVRRWACTGVYL